MKHFGNVVNLFQHLTRSVIEEGMTALDATVGKGNDTLFLSNLVGKAGKVYAFDIQKEAIELSKVKLQAEALFSDNVTFILDSHANLSFYVREATVDVAVFNLGYLPSINKRVTTSADSTLIAIKQAMKALKSGGVLFVLCYRGHEAGAEEYDVLKPFFEAVSQVYYDVFYSEFVNQKNNPPVMWVIEKK